MPRHTPYLLTTKPLTLLLTNTDGSIDDDSNDDECTPPAQDSVRGATTIPTIPANPNPLPPTAPCNASHAKADPPYDDSFFAAALHRNYLAPAWFVRFASWRKMGSCRNSAPCLRRQTWGIQAVRQILHVSYVEVVRLGMLSTSSAHAACKTLANPFSFTPAP